MIELTAEQQERMLLWVKALRSGKYRQGLGALMTLTHDGLAYCCLGVLCEVALANGVDIERIPPTQINMVGIYADSASFPPRAVRQWLGIYGGDLELVHEGKAVDAVTLNDSVGATFDQIADAIVATYGLKEPGTEVTDDTEAGAGAD